jgi:hypothetical protein
MKKLQLVVLLVFATGVGSLTGQDQNSSFKTRIRELSSFHFAMLHSAVTPFRILTTLESNDHYFAPSVLQHQGLSLAYQLSSSVKSNFNVFGAIGLNYNRTLYSIPVAPDPRWVQIPYSVNQTPDMTLFDYAHFADQKLSVVLCTGYELWLKNRNMGFYFDGALYMFLNKTRSQATQNQFTHSDTLRVIHQAQVVDWFPYIFGFSGGAFIRLNDQFLIQLGLNFTYNFSDYMINQTNHYYTIDGNGDPQHRETSIQGTRIEYFETNMPINIAIGIRYQLSSAPKIK